MEDHIGRVCARGEDDTSYWVTFTCTVCGEHWQQHSPDPPPDHLQLGTIVELHVIDRGCDG